jgi:hypothetical protein
MLLRLILNAAIAVLVAGSAAAQNTSVARINETAGIRQGWSGEPGSLVIIWMPRVASNGAIEICGAWTLDDVTLRRGANQVLSGALVRAGGASTRLNLRQLPRARDLDEIETMTPSCLPTQLPGSADSVEISFRSGNFRD